MESCCKQCDLCCKECDACFKPCCDCLAHSCSFVTQLCDKPFGSCVIFTFLANFIPFAALIYFLVHNWNNGCAHPLQTWLIIMLALFVVNSIFGCYIYKRISSMDEQNPEQNPKWNPALNYSRNMLNIQMDFWMNDPWVCIHIVVSIFSIVWAILGFVWVSDGANGGNVCPTQLEDSSTAASIIMLIFIGFGVLMIISTLCFGYMEHCISDCNLLHCLCCCLYYPLFYHYDPNYEGSRARQRRQQRVQRQDQSQALVVSVTPPGVAQGVPVNHGPMMAHPVAQPVMAQPVYHQQQPVVVVQPVSPQLHYQQQDYARPSFQAPPNGGGGGGNVTMGAPVPQSTSSSSSDDTLDKAKQKAAAVAEATGQKLKEGAAALQNWWNKPKEDAPGN